MSSRDGHHSKNVTNVEVPLPEIWETTLERYKERAKEWRDKAASLPDGDRRDSCVSIAEGYEKLIELVEAQRCNPKH